MYKENLWEQLFIFIPKCMLSLQLDAFLFCFKKIFVVKFILVYHESTLYLSLSWIHPVSQFVVNPPCISVCRESTLYLSLSWIHPVSQFVVNPLCISVCRESTLYLSLSWIHPVSIFVVNPPCISVYELMKGWNLIFNLMCEICKIRNISLQRVNAYLWYIGKKSVMFHLKIHQEKSQNQYHNGFQYPAPPTIPFLLFNPFQSTPCNFKKISPYSRGRKFQSKIWLKPDSESQVCD